MFLADLSHDFKHVVLSRLYIVDKFYMSSTVIKPGPAGRPGGWTGPGLTKDRLWQQPGQTRVTRWVDLGPGRTRMRPGFFFFQMWDLKHISIYTLYSQEKSHVFSMWDKKTFWFKYFNLKG
jgi:hypothetical protein